MRFFRYLWMGSIVFLLSVSVCNASGPADDFLKAASKGRVSQLRAMLEDGMDVDVRDARGRSALFIASDRGSPDTVRVLVKHHAGIDERDFEGTTPLMIASLRGHHDILIPLLNAGADVNALDYFGSSALIMACKKGHMESAKILIHNGGDPCICDYDGMTPMAYALDRKDKEIAGFLEDAMNPLHSTVAPDAQEDRDNKVSDVTKGIEKGQGPPGDADIKTEDQGMEPQEIELQGIAGSEVVPGSAIKGSTDIDSVVPSNASSGNIISDSDNADAGERAVIPVSQFASETFEGDTVLIKQIQTLLLYLGYRPGSSDGMAGPRTYSAITKFEKDEVESSYGFRPGQECRMSPPGEISDDLLCRLERRKLVFRVQSMLQVLGFDPGSADGKKGPETIRAVKAFEQAQGMETTGEVTDELLQSLIDARGKN